MIGLQFRGTYDFNVELELEQMAAATNALWLVQHKDDGTHSDVTADSVTVTGDVSIGGHLTVDGDTSVGDLFVGRRSFLGWDRDERQDVLGQIGGLGQQLDISVVRGAQVLSAAERIREAGINADMTIDGTTTLRIAAEMEPKSRTYDPYRMCCIVSAINMPVIDRITAPESDATACRFFLINQTSTPVKLEHSNSGPSSILCPEFRDYWLMPWQGVWLNWNAHASNVAWNVEGPQTTGVWIPYTPTWTAATTNPANPSLIQGFYMVIGKTVFVKGSINMGASTTYGSGVWFISLPIAPKNLSNDTVLCGETFLFDSGTNFRVGVCTIRTTTAPLALQTIFDSSSNVSSATVPITWANGDRLTWSGSYELA